MGSFLNNRHRLQSLAFLLLGAGLFAHSLERHRARPMAWSLSPYLFPLVIACLIMAFSLLLLCSPPPARAKAAERKTVLPALLLCAAYCFSLTLLPYVAATALFLAAFFLLLGERRPGRIVPASLLSAALLYLLFGVALRVMLP